MARALRIEYSGAFYHVTSRGNERKEIFPSRRDREQFLSYLESATVRYGARIHVYCLMSNHYHLLVETPLGNLSQIMKHVNSAYTTYFNVKRNRAGHLLQGRYKAILVEKDEYAQELSRYIHLNPVRAIMVERPDLYEWSSYRAYAGLVTAPAWLYRELIHSLFGSDERTAQKGYRKFVEEAVEGMRPSPLDNVAASTLLGSESFVEWVRKKFLKETPQDRELPALRQLAGKPTLKAICQKVEGKFVDAPAKARRLCMYLCWRHTGLKLREIGAEFGVGESAVTQASRRVAEELKSSESMRECVDQIKRDLGL
jgi:putative transposase